MALEKWRLLVSIGERIKECAHHQWCCASSLFEQFTSTYLIESGLEA